MVLSRVLPCLLLLFAVITGTGCRQGGTTASPVILRVWSHQGQEAENQALRSIAAAFNDAHASEGLQVELTFFPDFQYTEKLSIAAAADDLPDAFDLDGPLVARFAEAGLLQPLDAWVTAEDRRDFLPTILAQGTVHDQRYALGAFESAVVLYYDRDWLARAEVTPPAAGQAWSWDEFLAACEKLQATGLDPVALHMDDAADEWYTYAFSPVLWSAGGRLISGDGTTVAGVLASWENVEALQRWQALFTRGYAATDPVEPDPFGRGHVAMDWSGHWMARGHLAAKGDRLGVMPLPRLGAQSVAPSGSWCWALSQASTHPEAAARWLRWVTGAQTGVIPMVRANGAVPARRSAFDAFPEYSSDPYRLFRQQLETIARPRPRTPYYATLTQRFAGAVREIARGAEVRRRLQVAEREIQEVIDRREQRKGGGS